MMVDGVYYTFGVAHHVKMDQYSISWGFHTSALLSCALGDKGIVYCRLERVLHSAFLAPQKEEVVEEEEAEETSIIWNQAPDSSFFHSYLHSASLPSAPGATPKQNGVFTCKDEMLPLPWTVQY